MSLTLYTGCMFAGKTTELIREGDRYISIGKSVLWINHLFDNRYSENEVVAHSKLSRKCLSVEHFPEKCDEDVIIIDEGQFFAGLVKFCLEQVEVHGKIVIVGGLDSDYSREKFGEINDLARYCDTIIKLKAFCKLCLIPTQAIFTRRTTQKKEQINIGSHGHIPVCRHHYLSN